MQIEVKTYHSTVRLSRRARLRAWWRRRRLGSTAYAIVREIEAEVERRVLFGVEA